MRMGHDPEIRHQLDRVDPQRLRQHVEMIAALGPRSVDDPGAVSQTLTLLESILTEYGYRVQQEPYAPAAHQQNLIVQRRGWRDPAQVLEIGAHYDTVRGSPGADDNASGVAGVLELARILSTAELSRTVRFCLFGAEESGLTGSGGHVVQLDLQKDEQVAGIVVFEMIGYRTVQPHSQRSPVRIPVLLWPPRQGDFIAIVSDYRSRSIADHWHRAARRYVPQLRVYAVKRIGGFFKDAARSDHVPYWQARRRGIMITDTANFRNPNYHQPGDLPHTLDYEFAAAVTKATLAMLLRWAR